MQGAAPCWLPMLDFQVYYRMCMAVRTQQKHRPNGTMPSASLATLGAGCNG